MESLRSEETTSFNLFRESCDDSDCGWGHKITYPLVFWGMLCIFFYPSEPRWAINYSLSVPYLSCIIHYGGRKCFFSYKKRSSFSNVGTLFFQILSWYKKKLIWPKYVFFWRMGYKWSNVGISIRPNARVCYYPVADPRRGAGGTRPPIEIPKKVNSLKKG